MIKSEINFNLNTKINKFSIVLLALEANIIIAQEQKCHGVIILALFVPSFINITLPLLCYTSKKGHFVLHILFICFSVD